MPPPRYPEIQPSKNPSSTSTTRSRNSPPLSIIHRLVDDEFCRWVVEFADADDDREPEERLTALKAFVNEKAARLAEFRPTYELLSRNEREIQELALKCRKQRRRVIRSLIPHPINEQKYAEQFEDAF